MNVKYVDWNAAKNEILKTERGVSFEEVVSAIFEGKVFTIIVHPNQVKYPGQKIYVIELHEYAYLVPFKEDEEKIFLKTIFPSRKYTQKYIEKGNI